MKVKLLFFGSTADKVGERQTEMQLSGTKAGEALSEIVRLYPQLNGQKLLLALNQEYPDSDALISDGDELAVFTAVSGG